MSCIGTAGHVDHGKSTLVTALTGIDPDRLAEEKARGMTIDLGFAWLTLPSGREVSIVDVPGHENFIKNMLAGVGSIDTALLVVAADEGVMPQTREHLAILDLLHVPRGVVALTKADLVDEEWLDLVREEVRAVLKSTTLAEATIIPVSATTGAGLPELRAALDQVLDEAQAQKNIARPRLSIDRVFSLTGFGTVVTGTLLDGVLQSGQEVEILPQQIVTRIRGLQTHKQQIELAQPGSRVALNLANVARSDLARGNVIAQPGQMRTTLLCDARIELLADAGRPLQHNAQVDFYNGSQEIPARVRLLDRDELQPGERGWVQLRLSRPAVLTRRDRFILRLPSPSTTIGGGEVIDITPSYHRRRQPNVIAVLERLEDASPDELVLAILDQRSSTTKGIRPGGAYLHAGQWAYTLEEIVKRSNLAQDVTQETLETLLSEGRVYKVGSYWFAQQVWDTLTQETLQLVQQHQQQYPLRSGFSKEEWRTRLNLSPKLAAEIFIVFQSAGNLETVEAVTTVDSELAGNAVERSTRSGGLIRIPGFRPHFTEEQQSQVKQLMQRYQQQAYTPPGRSEAEATVGVEIVNALIEQEQLVKVGMGEGVLFARSAYETALSILVNYLREHDSMTVAEARDAIGTSRKYILPLLEHMDTLRITRRQGDERRLGTLPSTWHSDPADTRT
jgi:selenocysteine-specific elongation factor